MKQEKKNFILFAAVVLACMVISATTIVLTDPFFHYHDVWFSLPLIQDSAVYQTPGAAKMKDYDSAIVGTSMTENFHASWFDEELGWKTVKLSYSGARSDDIKAVLDAVFDGGNEPEHIFMDIEDYQLTEPADSVYAERPEYLYDDNPLNDYQYVFNHDVLVRVVNLWKDKANRVIRDNDDAYTWEDPSYFCKENAKKDAEDLRKRYLKTADELREKNENPAAQQKLLDACAENLLNITPLIEAHPDTEFIIYFPPYSMLYWEEEVLSSELEGKIEQYRLAAKTLLNYDNVKLYYFQDERDIITNLDNYRDVCHHSYIYNRYILECIAKDSHRMTLENCDQLFDEMYDFAKDYDYSSYWN